MPDEIRSETEPVVVTSEPVVVTHEPAVVEQPVLVDEEVPTGDAEKGAVLGGVGGLVTGAIAGAGAGPAGAIIGAVVGGVVGAAASGVAVAAVDRIDDDTHVSGLPDDMSINTPDEREPVVIDRTATPVVIETEAEAPIGVGVQEAIIATQPVTTEAIVAEPLPTRVETTTVATTTPLLGKEPMGEGVTGDAEMPGTAPHSRTMATDGGWDRDIDANTINVNPSDASGRGSYAYVDDPEHKDAAED